MIRLILLLLFLHAFANAQVITTVVGNGSPGYGGDGGPAASATLHRPFKVVFDNIGNMYIVDLYNNCIRRVDTSGYISRFAGIVGTWGFGGDGGPATTAAFNQIDGLAFDGTGNAYVADGNNNRVRKIDTAGIVSTFAGCDTSGYGGDGGPATVAKLNYPNSVAIDSVGNVYISDCANNRIRKVNTSGIISTVAGSGSVGYCGDGGPATAACLWAPFSVALDANGNVYIMDDGNSVVRKVNTAGIISTIIGNHIPGYSGDGCVATLAQIGEFSSELSVDGFDNMYFGDFSNNVVRKVNLTSGIINTIAGNGVAGFGGDGGQALASRLNGPVGISFDKKGNAFIPDFYNNRVRKIGDFLSIRGSNIVCVGGTSALTDTVGGGTWSSSNTSIVTVDLHTGIATGLAPGMATMFYTKPGYSASFTMMVKSPLVPGAFSASRDSVCIGDTVLLHNSTLDGIWMSEDTTIAKISANGLLTGMSSGVVNLKYILRNVCGADTAAFPFIVGKIPCQSDLEHFNGTNESSLTISPNPNYGIFRINVSSRFTSDAKVIITNILGEKIKELVAATNKDFQIELDEPAGIYFISIVSKYENKTAKVLLW